MRDYFVSVFYSEADEGYIADIPDLEFCSAFGDTPEEAVRELQIAKELWLQTAREEGIPIPPPCYFPVHYQGLTRVRPAHMRALGADND